VKEYNYLAFVMAFIWGLQDSCSNTQVSEILGFEFENNVESYAGSTIIQSFGVMLIAGIDIFIVNQQRLFIFNLVIGILGILMCSKTLEFDFKKDSKSL